MPTYTYECSKCKHVFELFFYIRDYKESPKCIKCHSKNTNRNYICDVATQSTSVKKTDTELKTLGDLANRNRDKMSEDQKNELTQKHNSYKEQKLENPLPAGMSRIKKPKSKTKWT
jgi:putative FmdB family regulatory protein